MEKQVSDLKMKTQRAIYVWGWALLHLVGCSRVGASPPENDKGGRAIDSDTGADTGIDSAADSDADTGDDTDTAAAEFEVSYHLASDVAPDAPGTVGIVTWSLNRTVTQAGIEFGLDTGYGMTAPVDLNEGDFRTLLLGMKPSNTYHFRIVAEAGDATYTSDDFTIDTGPPPQSIIVNRFDVIDEEARERGFIVASYWQGSDEARRTPFIIDSDGDIVWWYPSEVVNGIARARMSADGKRMWMTDWSNRGGLLQWVTMDALQSETYDVGASHDLTAVSGATMAYLDYTEDDCDSIHEIDPGGVDVEVFEGSGVIITTRPQVGCHLNAIRYSKAEDVYTVSDLTTDIYVINRNTAAPQERRLEWRLSERVGSNSDWGGTNHGHHLLDDSLLVFGNTGGDNNLSLVVEYDLDGDRLMSYESGLNAMNLGDVLRLPGGNTLVAYSNTDSIIHEISHESGVPSLVLEIDLSVGEEKPYLGYIMWRETLYGPPPDIGL